MLRAGILFAALAAPAADLVELRRLAEIHRLQPPEHAIAKPFRDAARDWVFSQLPPPSSAPDAYLETDGKLVAQLRAAGLIGQDDACSNGCPAYLLGLKVYTPSEFPGWIVVILKFGAGCGSDDSVYLFRPKGHSWERALTSERDPADGHGHRPVTDVRFSAPDAQGRRLALITRDAARCASNWSWMWHQVFRVGAVTTLVGEIEHSQFAFNLRTRLDPGDLWLDYVDFSVSPLRHSRLSIRHYAVTETALVRRPPFALHPADFLEEFLRTNWSEASQFAAPELREAHRQRYGMHGDFDFILACSGGRIQYGIRMADESLWWFLVAPAGRRDYRIMEVGRNRHAACTQESNRPEDFYWSLKEAPPRPVAAIRRD